jgi:hypothetical protein
MGQTLHKIAIVREKKQAFALRIEAADVSKRGELRRQQIENRVGRVQIAPSADKPGRFIQGEVNVLALPEELPVYLDVIGRGWLEMKISAWLPVYGHATGRDEFIRSATRSNARSGEKAIETHRQ